MRHFALIRICWCSPLIPHGGTHYYSLACHTSSILSFPAMSVFWIISQPFFYILCTKGINHTVSFTENRENLFMSKQKAFAYISCWLLCLCLKIVCPLVRVYVKSTKQIFYRKYKILHHNYIIIWSLSVRTSYLIGTFTHLKLCLADAVHNFKWVKITQIWQNGGQQFWYLAVWYHVLSLICLDEGI